MGVLAVAEVLLKATGFKKTNKSIDSTRTKFANFAGLTEKDMKKLEGGLKSFAKTAVVSLGVVSAVVVKMGADFEKQMAIVGGVSRASEEDLIRLEKAARESGATTEKTAKQSAEAMQFLAMAGLEANEIMEALPGVINLSTAANIDLASSADIATNVLAGMGLQVSDLARVNDTLVAASTRANTNVLELGEAFKYVAPVAKAVNLSLEDTSAILGTLANSGVKASDAGTDLRQALVRTGKVAKQLGMDEGSTLIDVLKRIKKEQWGVTEVTKAFGLIATKSVLILKDNIDEYEKLAVSIKGASGEAEELADKIRDTLSVQFTTMISALQEAGLQIFDIFKDDLKDIVKLLTEAIKGAYGLIEAFKELYDLRSVSETFAAGVELISGGALDMSIAEFSELSFKERQKLVDRYEKELLKLREEGETEAQKLLKKYNKEAIDEIKIDAINKIAMYRSYLGEWGGLFDDSYKEQIKNQQQFLKELSANAKDADFSIGAELDKSLKGTNKFREVFDVSTVLSPFDESGLDLEGITEFDEALERETKILAELAAAQQKEIDLIDKKNAIALKIHEDEKKRLEMLDSFIKTSPAFKTTEKDASSAVGEFTKTLVEASAAIDGGMTAMLQAMEATIDVFPNLINAFTSLIDAIADFPDTMFSSLGSLQESVSGFASGGFGWRGREEREKEREIERQKMLELKLELESEWDSIIAVFDMTDIETAMYNLNEKYQEQIQSAFDSGASLEKLTEARNKEILSIRATELERNQALFSGIFTGAEKFKRDIDLAAAPDQTAFLMDEFSSFSNELSALDLTTEEQSKILEQQLSTLKEMYGLAVSESAALEASNTAVQNMIDSLTLQSVGTSFDDIESRYNELYDQALSTLDTSDIQSFLTFTNDYMATLEAAGMDAESIRSDTKDDLGVLQSAIGEQLSEVAANTIAIIDMTTAVDEMALDLKEAADAIIIASSPLEVYQDPEYPDLRLDEAGQDLEEGLTDYSVGEVIVETAKAITDPIVTPIVDVVKSIGSVFGFAGGGLADNASIFGEDGPEWAIPAYNNSNNENFLKSVGMDKVIEAISKKGGGGGEQQIIINLNGKTIADVVVSEINNDGELTQVMKNTVN